MIQLSIADLALQISLALIAIIVAINARGPVRASLSGVLAALIAVIAVVMTMFYFNTGPLISEQSKELGAIKGGDRLRLSGPAAETTQEMKAPLRQQHEAAAEAEKREISAGGSDSSIDLYRKQLLSPVSEARSISQAIRSFSLDNLASLSDSEYKQRQSDALQLRNDAYRIADTLQKISPPKRLSNTHQSLIGASEHLRQAGRKLQRFFSAENEAEEKALQSGVVQSANAALRSIENFSKAAAL